MAPVIVLSIRKVPGCERGCVWALGPEAVCTDSDDSSFVPFALPFITLPNAVAQYRNPLFTSSPHDFDYTMSAATDRTPLLPTSNGNSSPNGRSASPKPQTALQKFAELIKAEDGPSYTASLRYFLFGSWLNILLVFVPLSYCSHVFNWDAGLRFLFSFIAIMPLAAVSATPRVVGDLETEPRG